MEKFFSVVGHSMKPYLQEGDLLQFGPVGDGIKLGSVVLLRVSNGERPVVHRLVSGTSLFFKGDSAKRYDHQLFDKVEVVGVVEKRVIIEKNTIYFVQIKNGILAKTMAVLSSFNQHKLIFFHRVISASIQILGWLLRKTEVNRKREISDKRIS